MPESLPIPVCPLPYSYPIDLDETLIHSSFTPIPYPDHVVHILLEGVSQAVYVRTRPYLHHFLAKVRGLFEVCWGQGQLCNEGRNRRWHVVGLSVSLPIQLCYTPSSPSQPLAICPPAGCKAMVPTVGGTKPPKPDLGTTKTGPSEHELHTGGGGKLGLGISW